LARSGGRLAAHQRTGRLRRGWDRQPVPLPSRGALCVSTSTSECHSPHIGARASPAGPSKRFRGGLPSPPIEPTVAARGVVPEQFAPRRIGTRTPAEAPRLRWASGRSAGCSSS